MKHTEFNIDNSNDFVTSKASFDFNQLNQVTAQFTENEFMNNNEQQI